MRKPIRKTLFVVCLAGIFSTGNAQYVTLTGTVRDQNRQPLSGVTVSLPSAGKTTTTGADGKYSFNGSAIIKNITCKNKPLEYAVVSRKLVKFNLREPVTSVQICLFDLTGKYVASLINDNMQRGEYTIDPYIAGLTNQVYVLKIRLGSFTQLMKLAVSGKIRNTASVVSTLSNSGKGLAKVTADSDTIRLVKNGYSYEKKWISSYSGVHDFIMTDTAWFWGDRSKIPAAQNVMTYVFLNRTYGKYTDEQMFWKFGNMPVRSFAEAPYYDMGANSSGRVYCYAGSSNSKYNDFMEHTISSTTFNGNTTRVDGFVLPCAIRLHCKDGFDITLGEEYHMFAIDRDSLWKAYQDAVPVEFDSCARWDSDGTPLRIIAPGKGEGVFNAGQKYADYFTDYLKQIGQGSATTNQVFSCSGTPYGNNAALAGATNRHVAHLPQSQWNDKSLFYKEAPANFYAKFFHDHSFNGKAYGFAYDDAAEQAAYVSHSGPQYLIIAVGW